MNNALPAADAAGDPAWDALLAETGAHYAQTSLWAMLKARAGWRPIRVTVEDGDGIAAAAQLLVRPLPAAFGKVGWVSKGPMLVADDAAHSYEVVDRVVRAAAAHGVRWLGIQPPVSGNGVERALVEHSFRVNAAIGMPPATLRLDLSWDRQALLAAMRKSTRQNIQRAESNGVTVRRGGEADLDVFFRLRTQASLRKGFYTHPESYFREMWRLFRPTGSVELFIAEYRHEVVSAMIAIVFGSAVYSHASAWSGSHGQVKPNEALKWGAICWAQENGYRHFDMEGIRPEGAPGLDQSARPSDPRSVDPFVTTYKLGFGGQPVGVPPAYEYIPNPFLRWGYQSVYLKVAHTPWLKAIRSRAMRLVQGRN